MDSIYTCITVFSMQADLNKNFFTLHIVVSVINDCALPSWYALAGQKTKSGGRRHSPPGTRGAKEFESAAPSHRMNELGLFESKEGSCRISAQGSCCEGSAGFFTANVASMRSGGLGQKVVGLLLVDAGKYASIGMTAPLTEQSAYKLLGHQQLSVALDSSGYSYEEGSCRRKVLEQGFTTGDLLQLTSTVPSIDNKAAGRKATGTTSVVPKAICTCSRDGVQLAQWEVPHGWYFAAGGGTGTAWQVVAAQEMESEQNTDSKSATTEGNSTSGAWSGWDTREGSEDRRRGAG